jgi:DNA topoisomerase-3
MLAPRLASVRVNPHGHRGRVGPRVIGDDAGGSFYDKGLEGASHHAVIPNVNTIDKLREVWPRLTTDEKKLFDVIARAYLAALMPDFRYRQTTATLDVHGFEFRAAGRQPIDLGWRAASRPKTSAPPTRYNEGTLIEAMQIATGLRELREAK